MAHSIALLLVVTGLPLLVAVCYLGLLTLLSARPAPHKPSPRRLRFTVLVPAHDEAAGIAATVESLLGLQWPAEDRRVLVVADNCTDDTADRARMAGASVMERRDEARRGKGYALQLAYEAILADSWSDAVVVVDADTEVSPNLLSAFAARIAPDDGPAWGAAQAFYGVRNPAASWRTRLVTIALAVFHRLRGRARARLGVSNKLNGNGMCFAVATLQQVPHQAFSIAEDLEYGIALARAGIAIAYVDEAEVRAEMVSTSAAAESQRQRWEGGRALMRKTFGWPLLREAVQQRSLLLLDQAMDVLVPPLSIVVVWALAFALACAGAVAAGLAASWLLPLAALPLLLIVAHVARGAQLSGLGLSAWRDLACAPLYILWALALRLKPQSQGWVRTQREADTESKLPRS